MIPSSRVSAVSQTSEKKQFRSEQDDGEVRGIGFQMGWTQNLIVGYFKNCINKHNRYRGVCTKIRIDT